ncbi:Uncharacterised protein [Mycobacteroides abscessus subsp. abscessus]|nr:Uncharacterised protein [Mycobacteroides abscessus subsp. abscessus]
MAPLTRFRYGNARRIAFSSIVLASAVDTARVPTTRVMPDAYAR